MDDKILYKKAVKELLIKVKNLTTKEKSHILNILKKYNIEYTKNSNGYFFNLNDYIVKYNILDKILKCIYLIESKRDIIAAMDKKRDDHLEYYRSLIDDKLKETINSKNKHYIDKLLIHEFNINISIKKPLSKIKDQSNMNPDILMNEYSKNKKYNKNSVHFRLNQTLQELSKNHRYKRPNINSFNCDAEVDGLCIEDADIDIIDDVDIEVDIIEECDINIEDEEIDNEVDIDDEDEDEDDNYDEDEDNDELESNDSNFDDHDEMLGKGEKKKKSEKKKVEKNKINVNELDYFKNLLKKDGFKFDDDKLVIMRKEEYI